MMTKSLKVYLTKDLLEMLGVSEHTLRNAVRRGALHPHRLSNGLYIWNKEAVEEAKSFFKKTKEAKTTKTNHPDIPMTEVCISIPQYSIEAFFSDDYRYHNKIFVYQFHHIDAIDFMLDAEQVLIDAPHGDHILRTIELALKKGGWEGDGRLQLLWVPPFIHESDCTYGDLVFHVKQRNNGTSWIASTFKLDHYKGLKEQNRYGPTEIYARQLWQEQKLVDQIKGSENESS